jgi:Mrp family chromosome partitioning ATPase
MARRALQRAGEPFDGQANGLSPWLESNLDSAITVQSSVPEGEMAKSIAFFNNKGGVGKTTLLCNVAAYAAEEHGLKVLVIDADPQCNATQYMFDDKKLAYF